MSWISPVACAALLLAVEGVALTVLGVGYGVAGVVGDPFDRTATLLEAAMVVTVGALVLAVARGVGQVRGWSRSPAVVVQLFALPVGVGLVQGAVWAAAVPVLGLAGSVLWCLMTAEARLAFREQETR